MKHIYALQEVVPSTFLSIKNKKKKKKTKKRNKCIEKWSHELNIHFDTRAVFRHLNHTGHTSEMVSVHNFAFTACIKLVLVGT